MSGNKNRSRIALKVEGGYRKAFLRLYANKKKSVLVTEYPKSGGSWLSLMISEIAGISFPRNTIPTIKTSIFQGHYLSTYGISKSVVLWRDPKDILVSWYHHSVIGNDHSNPKFVQQTRVAIGANNPEDIKGNLSNFIEYSFSGRMSPGFNWNDFFDRWFFDDSVLHIRYEDLVLEPFESFSKLVLSLGFSPEQSVIEDVLDKYSFKNVSGRNPGISDEKSFVRKGVVGDWKNYFSEGDLQLYKQLVGDRTAKAGYLDEA